jgi:hypothetical protein
MNPHGIPYQQTHDNQDDLGNQRPATCRVQLQDLLLELTDPRKQVTLRLVVRVT